MMVYVVEYQNYILHWLITDCKTTLLSEWWLEKRSIWLTVRRVADMNFPIRIHFEGKKQLSLSNRHFLHKQSQYRNIHNSIRKFLEIKCHFNGINITFEGICWRASSVCHFGFCYVLCGMAYADWVPCVLFNHKPFYFLWIHLFHSKCFMFFFFYAHSLVFHYDEYDEQKSEVQALNVNAFVGTVLLVGNSSSFKWIFKCGLTFIHLIPVVLWNATVILRTTATRLGREVKVYLNFDLNIHANWSKTKINNCVEFKSGFWKANVYVSCNFT